MWIKKFHQILVSLKEDWTTWLSLQNRLTEMQTVNMNKTADQILGTLHGLTR